MNRTDAKSKLEYLETSEEEKAHGLRRIKRRHATKPGEMTLKDCWVEITLSLDAEVLQFFNSDEKKINQALREKMEESKNSNFGEMKNLRRELLEDEEFLHELKTKLAA